MYKNNEAKNRKETEIQQEKIAKEATANQEKSATVDISDWKVYRDGKYGFEIKYPKEWEIKESRGPAIGGDYLMVIVDRNRNDIGMGINRFKLNKNPRKWLEDEGIGEITFDKQFYINDYPVYYIRKDNKAVHLVHGYLMSNEGKIIWFSFTEKYRKINPKTNEITETSFSQYLPAFEAMVNSIKFVD